MAATPERLTAIDAALTAGRLTEHSAKVIREWLTLPQFSAFADDLGQRIDQQLWQELDDAYWTVIPFGTGGRRGTMYPVGCNVINDRTIGESAQGLADYVGSVVPAGTTPTCTIAYDTRHRSEHFAKLCSEVLLAAGFKIFFLRGFRSTPELSYGVRHTQSDCGIMVTASHNPPSDNAVKVYWAGGVQVLPPHDRGIIDRVMNVVDVARSDFAAGVADGRVRFVEAEIDPAFVAAVLEQSTPGSRDVSVLYTPLHGVGASAVVPVLAGAGFAQVRLYGPQETPDGDFPNVPGHVANPENPAVLAGAIEEAKAAGDDLVLASDPDCDRLGAAAPLTLDAGSGWDTFTGNQLGALLADWTLTTRARSGKAAATDRVITTIVTSGLVRRVAEHHGIRAIDNLLVGFKWIGQRIDAIGPEHFAFGCEESHGYLAGTHVRDKDAAVAALLLAEMVASLKAEGRSLHQHLDGLFAAHGCHLERQVSIALPGAAGMDRMKEIMAGLRDSPPSAIAGLTVSRGRDYASLTARTPDGTTAAIDGTAGDVMIFDLGDAPAGWQPSEPNQFPPLANAVAARPSGTEPKIKFYLFTAAPPCSPAELPAIKQQLAERLDAMEHELRAVVGV
ncbi:MAG: phospho-sugar mutase [Planctomycetota bacterium]|nr:phospho-sugar mutase [Planctomycetota bacterium]